MQQYNVDFFDRNMGFIFSSTVPVGTIDDDYLSAVVNTVDVDSTLRVANGQYIRLECDDYTYFGLVTDVSPGEHVTTVQFKPFLSIFEEDYMFNTSWQGTEETGRPTLEAMLRNVITDEYISTSDTYQRLPISIDIDPTITQTANWNLGLLPDAENVNYKIVNIYRDLIVGAIKKYGVVVDIDPKFSTNVIRLTVTQRKTPFKIDADLDNVYVKTLKYQSKNVGTNKLIVYNANNYTTSITYYVHSDNSWDTEDRDRITPVTREIKAVSPDSSVSDPARAFAIAAVNAAHNALSGTAWDNLIELESYVDDENITPMSLRIGQSVSIVYKEAKYTSLLTGRKIEGQKITLLFGSERIEYTKRFKMNGGK